MVCYSCYQCDFKARWKQSLKRHIDSAHGDVGFTCYQCEYLKTKRKDSLKTHKDSVHGDLWYTCDLCDYKAKRNYFLRKKQS